jgi:hypothetical protein
MVEFLTFKRMVTPILIQIVFWLAVVGIMIAGIVTAVGGLLQMGRAPTAGLGMVVTGIAIFLFGPLVARIYAEILMVIFRINETLTDLSETLSKENRGVPQP